MTNDLKTTTSWVQKTPGVCGGDACIRNTRITVWGLVLNRRLGASDAIILENIVGLRSEDLDAAWDYYRHHSDEIDEEIRLNEEPGAFFHPSGGKSEMISSRLQKPLSLGTPGEGLG